MTKQTIQKKLHTINFWFDTRSESSCPKLNKKKNIAVVLMCSWKIFFIVRTWRFFVFDFQGCLFSRNFEGLTESNWPKFKKIGRSKDQDRVETNLKSVYEPANNSVGFKIHKVGQVVLGLKTWSEYRFFVTASMKNFPSLKLWTAFFFKKLIIWHYF